MKKRITKNEYRRFTNASGFIIDRRDVEPFHKLFIKVFTLRKQLLRAQVKEIGQQALISEAAAREFIETYLIKGMGIEEDEPR